MQRDPQRLLRLALPKLDGQRPSDRTAADWAFRTRLRHPSETAPPGGRQLANLLREHVAAAVENLTRCIPAAAGAWRHHGDALAAVAELAITAGIVPDDEARRTSRQLAHPDNLADWLAVWELTRREQRAPAELDLDEPRWARVERKLDTIAAHLAGVKGGDDEL